MDPTVCLNEIRSLTSEAVCEKSDGLKEVLVDDLAEHIANLDGWLSSGGFLPEQWRPRLGRPNRVGDGEPVLQDVPHGRRGSYNSGCRCMLCTLANRRKGNLTEEEMEYYTNGNQ